MLGRQNYNSLPTVVDSNKFILLDNPQSIWLFNSGEIALFAVPYQDGVVKGARRYLFSPQIGEALFGLSNKEDLPYAIIAVAIEESRLQVLSKTEAEAWAIQNPDQFGKNVTNWTKNLAVAVSKLPTVEIEPPSDLLDGEMDDRPSWDIVLPGLSAWHGELIRSLQQGERLEDTIDRERLQARSKRDRAVIEGSLNELASVLLRKEPEEFRAENSLLAAAGAVGRALGIKISPPADSEDLTRVKDPLQAIARASQIRTRRVVLEGNWWEADCGPILGYGRDDDRPLALLPVTATSYEIFDPETGGRRPVTIEEAQKLQPIGYSFYRPLTGEKVTTLAFLRFILPGRKRDLLVVLLAGVLATLLGMVTPQATAILIDFAIPDGDRGLLFQLGLGLIAANFGSALFSLVRGLTTVRLETGMDATSQAAIWDRLLKLQLSFFRRYSTGDLQYRASAIAQIRDILSGQVIESLFTSFFSLLNLGLLFIYNSQLALVAVGVALVAIGISFFTGSFVSRQIRPLNEIEGRIDGLMVQMIGGVSKLRVAGAETRAFAYWSGTYSQQLRFTLNTQLAEDLLSFVNKILPTIGKAILYVTAVYLITRSNAALSTGTFLAFNTAFIIFIEGMTQLSNTLTEIIRVTIFWERATPILQTRPELDLDSVDPGQLEGRVKLDRVSFRYRPDSLLTLSDVTITANAGEFIALVGPSGSGKSTTIRLLLGFEKPEEGAIYYDGQDLSGLDNSAVRRQLGVVLQNGKINSASIFELISGGALITMSEAWNAAKKAGFDRDIESMPMGMHTVISEGGSNLSGGQRQRLLIARSLALDPKIVIFDEATSALDNQTQAIVSENLESLNVTRIVIAHRLSTIRNADRIYVLEAGRLVQQGTYEELMNSPGLFANLMARQVA